MILRVAFWNVENLFHWTAQHGRKTGPKSFAEYNAKLSAVARGIRKLFKREKADVIGLAEIGDRNVLQDLIGRLGGIYSGVWVDAVRDNQPGLGMLYRHAMMTATELTVYPDRQVIANDELRPRYIAAEFTLLARPLNFVIVVSHWKSNLGKRSDVLDDRKSTARELGDFLLSRSAASIQPVILMGDFNADPFDPIFDEQRLRGRRSYATIRWWRNEMACLYNPCWRFLTPDVPYREGCKDGYLQERPQTSLASGEGIYDQILVSKSLLSDERLVFREEDVSLYCDTVNSEHVGRGRKIPLRWSESWAHGSRGVSDHFPILAKIRIR